MSIPSIVRGSYIDVLIEDPDNPGAFLPLCGATTRTFTHRINTRDRFVRDCDDPEDIPARALVPTGEQWDMSVSGVYNRAQAQMISAATGQRRLYRFAVAEPDDDPVYESYWEGYARLTQRQIGGSDADDATSDLTFASDGQWTEHEGDATP